MHTEMPDLERPCLLEHRIGEALIVEEPATIEALRSGPGIGLPGVDLERGRLQVGIETPP